MRRILVVILVDAYFPMYEYLISMSVLKLNTGYYASVILYLNFLTRCTKDKESVRANQINCHVYENSLFQWYTWIGTAVDDINRDAFYVT